MPLSNTALQTAFNAGNKDGSLETPFYTCAGCDPQVLHLLAQQPHESRAVDLMEMAHAWDNGYFNARGDVLATSNKEK